MGCKKTGEPKVGSPQDVLSPLQSSILQLADGVHAIQSEEKYLRLRERVHRDS